MPFVWPAHLFNPANIKADVVQRVISGGRSLNNEEDVIATDGGGYWSVSFSGIILRTPKLLRAWDAWSSHLAGGVTSVFVPLVSLLTAPRPAAGNGLARPSSLHADDEYFPTEVAYATPLIVAETIGAMPDPSTVTIGVSQGARIEGGERFSIPGMRGHKIERVLSRAGQTATVRISPPARPSIPAGSSVIFDWPVIRAKAVIGQDLAPEVSFGRRAEVSISFVEDVSNA